MSQFFVNSSSGGGGGGATQFTEDVGVAVPAAGNINVLGGSGISTAGSGSTITISVKNSTTDTGQTVNLQTITLSTISCAAAGTYFFTTQLAAYTTAQDSAGGQLYTTVVSDGVTATVVGDTDSIAHRSTNLATIAYQITTSGTNAILQVTGVAGLTIDWGAITIYVYRG